MPKVKCAMQYCRSCDDNGLCTEDHININWLTQCGRYLINRRKAKLCKHCVNFSQVVSTAGESDAHCLSGNEINDTYERTCWVDPNPDAKPDAAKYLD
ncbi:hypothetical protein [Candidatus Formimonas warabiya]|uniref:Uncharacterized protein n=1 Tax=Formimonas warabiya TaxID=1761012 RepID=A0A3G1KMM1_FORW1|nr:hypothetical protein [Candidatus Formimonas warabiya]ATW23708.1 hypothetical protein DCMF_01890 [Candidatus Formimonas warabiya]